RNKESGHLVLEAGSVLGSTDHLGVRPSPNYVWEYRRSGEEDFEVGLNKFIEARRTADSVLWLRSTISLMRINVAYHLIRLSRYAITRAFHTPAELSKVRLLVATAILPLTIGLAFLCRRLLSVELIVLGIPDAGLQAQWWSSLKRFIFPALGDR